jgi:hypothetical protein
MARLRRSGPETLMFGTIVMFFALAVALYVIFSGRPPRDPE